MDLTPDSKIDEERVRVDIGAALIQAGYGDASDEEDLLEWHFCFERRECPGQRGEPCACAGVPFVSDKVWASLRPVLNKIGDARYQAGREDAARPMIDPADVRIVLDQRIGHSHEQPGVWDLNNPPDRAGRPCVECAARKRLRAAIEADRPRTVEEGVGDNPEEQRP